MSGIPILTLSETPLTGTIVPLKSLEDIVLSILILLLIAPLMVLTAIAIKLDSPGPVFFRQKRMGWNGKIFRVWKFRSMIVHQPENNAIKQAKNDIPPRRRTDPSFYNLIHWAASGSSFPPLRRSHCGTGNRLPGWYFFYRHLNFP